MNASLSLTLASTPAEIERLAHEFARFADAHALPAAVRYALRFALEEVVLNVIHHGYADRADQPIHVEVVARPGEVTARIEDRAPAFDPLQQPPPDTTVSLEQREVGGLGIYLSRRLLDGMEYTRLDGGNRLELRKRF